MNTKNTNEVKVETAKVVLDDVLSQSRKQSIYNTLKGVVAFKMFGGDIDGDLAAELTSQQYARLVHRPVGEVFPNGIPESDGQWTAFLLRDGQWTALRHLRRQWRHPTCSLDEIVRADCEDGDSKKMPRIELLDYDRDCTFQPNHKDDFLNSIESRIELKYVHAACAKIWARYGVRVRNMLRELVQDGASVEALSVKYGLTKNNIYVAKKRFMDVLRECGVETLAQVEACAA